MSATSIEWLGLLLVALFFAVSVVAEVKWLASRGWTTPTRAMVFVLITDVSGVLFGGFTAMISFLLLMAMAFGPAGMGSDASEWEYILVLLAATILPTAALLLFKRLGLLAFRIGKGRRTWIFSLLSTAAFVAVTFILPALVFYAFITIWK
jgi:hypothetical protein